MIQNEAFVAIEDTISRILEVDVQSIAQRLHKDLSALLKDQQYAQAYQALAQFSLMGVAQKHWKRIREVGVTALVFGQQQLVPSNMTSLVTGQQKIPEQLDMALNQLVTMVERDLEEQLRDALSVMIDNASLEDETHPLFKADLTVGGGGDPIKDMAQVGVRVRANLVTSRLASLGFITQAQAIGVTTYQVSELLDSRICPVCRFMHGQEFKVEGEINKIDAALRSNDPKELKSLAPWPSQSKVGLKSLFSMSAGDMQGAGYGSPPYHPGCRGHLVKVGTVDKLPLADIAAQAKVILDSLTPDLPKKNKVTLEELDGVDPLTVAGLSSLDESE